MACFVKWLHAHQANCNGTSKDGAHRVQPTGQNGHAPEERREWTGRGRGLVVWEGDFFLSEGNGACSRPVAHSREKR